MSGEIAPGGKLTKLPEPWVAEENWANLNGTFYGTEPHEYFSMRLSLLALAAAKPEFVEQAVRDGLSYGGLRIGGVDSRESPSAQDDAQSQEVQLQFVIAESVSLLHHVSETLLRFYLAHEGMPPCPWLKIAGELDYRTFKKRVRKRFDDSPLTAGRREELALVFYGSTTPPKKGPPADEWHESLDNIERWLQHFANWFLDESNLYNAAKHGLALRPGEASMRIDTPADEAEGRESPLINAQGPAVTYLERFGDDKLWHLAIRWLSPDRLMSEIYMSTVMLRSIWQIGRARYLGIQDEGEIVRFYGQPTWEDYVKSELGDADWRIRTKSMRMNLTYAYAYPPDLVCSECARCPRSDERARDTWRAYRNGGGELLVFCPECARRRFGST